MIHTVASDDVLRPKAPGTNTAGRRFATQADLWCQRILGKPGGSSGVSILRMIAPPGFRARTTESAVHGANGHADLAALPPVTSF